jgi:phage terminase, large subunit, PBSX family
MQKILLNWWVPKSPYRTCDAVIADGAVRSGKTLCMSISFVLWSMSGFNGKSFAVCGKTITSVRRNVVSPLVSILRGLGFSIEEKHSQNLLIIKKGRVENTYYLFGGRDESSASLIQGMTLCGVMLDEVALMPRSFVEQALARCSERGSKMWFNCNPEHPYHWFYLEWINKRESKNALYLHFTMDDNPSLSEEIKARYRSLYSGAFYERFVEGKWVISSGVVYPMFDPIRHVVKRADMPTEFEQFYISCDYGTVNPASFGLWGRHGGKWYRVSEYYYDSRKRGAQKTDDEYADDLVRLANGREITAVIVDPSAASFIQCLRRKTGFSVKKAKNDVLPGIAKVSSALAKGEVVFCEDCTDSLREFSMYVWAESRHGDSVKKEFDHAMDDIRYFVTAVCDGSQGSGFFATSVKRG